MIVADTNLIAHLLLAGPTTEAARAVHRRDSMWAAPPLWRSEVRNLLATRIRARLASLGDALAVLAAAEELIDGRDCSVPSQRVLELSAGSKCTAYDCEFVAVAELLDVALVTTDKEILRAFPDRAVTPRRFAEAE